MVFSLSFFVLTTIFVPMVKLSPLGRFTLALVFALSLSSLFCPPPSQTHFLRANDY